MTTYYADFDLTTGSNDGTTQANAWQTLQAAIDGLNGTTPTAGDIVLCTGTDTISTVIDVDQNSGTATNPLIFRGVNSSFSNDGTRATVDGNNNSIDLINFNNVDFIIFENFVIKNTDGGTNNEGVTATGYSTCRGIHFINTVFDDCYRGVNMGTQGLIGTRFFLCQFLNSSYGVYLGSNDAANTLFQYCLFDTLSLQGIRSPGAQVFLLDCYFIDVTDEAFFEQDAVLSLLSVVSNCTFENCGDGIESDKPVFIDSCRFTSCTVGIDSDGYAILNNVYMPDTGEDRANTTKITGNYLELVVQGTNNNDLSGTDTDGGYADPTTGDFNLDQSKASLYNTEHDLEA